MFLLPVTSAKQLRMGARGGDNASESEMEMALSRRRERVSKSGRGL